MTNPSYSEKLRDPRWQKLRLRAMETAGWRCSACFRDDRSLQVHHRRYVSGRDPWEYTLSELEVLCEDCHADKHGKPRKSHSRPREYTLAEAEASMREALRLQLEALRLQNPDNLERHLRRRGGMKEKKDK